MPHNEAYRLAEQKIEEARRSGAKELDLKRGYDDKPPKLTELPKSLGQLTQLQWLNLSHNQLMLLPEWLGQLRQLQSLDLSGNQLTALPESLGQLRQLQSLDLTNNQLSTLPELLGQLMQLQSLNLSGNQLTALPEWLGQLTQLQTLDLSRNQLTALPESMERLVKLRRLNLFSNKFQALPDSLGKLSLLKNLGVGNNPLHYLPDSLSECRQIDWLDLGDAAGGCPFGELPSFIRHLTKLRHLIAQSCDLSALPVWLGELTLEMLDLDNNPLNPELAAAYNEGLDAVKRYLRAKTGPQVVLNEAKLILIGEGEVGKSALLGALRGDEWVEKRDSTHGIEIKPVPVTDPATGTEITLNGWDFGGQRVYRPTHQLFFSAPAVYLVVWKPREGSQAGAVKEWIKLVKHREPEAKIIVVATHGGPGARQPDIDRQEIWDLFGKETVIDFFHVDSRPPRLNKKAGKRTGTRKGVKELKNTIARVAASLPEVGRSVPKHWQEAREALRKRGMRICRSVAF